MSFFVFTSQEKHCIVSWKRDRGALFPKWIMAESPFRPNRVLTVADIFGQNDGFLSTHHRSFCKNKLLPSCLWLIGKCLLPFFLDILSSAIVDVITLHIIRLFYVKKNKTRDYCTVPWSLQITFLVDINKTNFYQMRWLSNWRFKGIMCAYVVHNLKNKRVRWLLLNIYGGSKLTSFVSHSPLKNPQFTVICIKVWLTSSCL